MGRSVSPPSEMAPWNLALRFLLEIGALVGLGVGAWALSDGVLRWTAVVAVPLAAMVAWGVFNVPGDPSRSGEAPMPVRGQVRLGVELVVLLGGAVAWGASGRPWIGAAQAALTVAHYAMSGERLRWLLDA